MKVTMLLADSAQTVGGKLYILGGGWSITGPDPTPSAIALLIQVPWNQANVRHTFELMLLDADGHPVLLQTDQDEPQSIQVQGEFEAGRPPGLQPGTPLDTTATINISALPLPPGGRYVWELKIDGHTEEDWHLGFSTRPADSRGGS